MTIIYSNNVASVFDADDLFGSKAPTTLDYIGDIQGKYEQEYERLDEFQQQLKTEGWKDLDRSRMMAGKNAE
ncbi:hypothetical protein RHMOL_Rhmol01G0219000 [Rhododendron molle]|uniref:Uncharacterized protein n=1 Tax=Rhododendron molle TaxID=49168 RepID=A0ACC0Q4L0_RHOML|nr:hypothetical protein RHMOL_Rhmol01G0219000 [Rhododendron molle]